MNPPALSRYALRSEPLTAQGFAAFGEVIDAGRTTRGVPINQGYADRFGDLACVDTAHDGGRPMVSIYRGRLSALPFRLRLLERHRWGSQAFIPLGRQTFLVIVGRAETVPQPEDLRVFRTAPGQGINLARGVWHHPLAALDAGDFLVIERAATDGTVDCDEQGFATSEVWVDE